MVIFPETIIQIVTISVFIIIKLLFNHPSTLAKWNGLFKSLQKDFNFLDFEKLVQKIVYALLVFEILKNDL